VGYDLFKRILREGGISKDSILAVHSGIRRLSRKGYRAEAMIETLLDSTGTLVMPAMSWRTVTQDRPFWDEIETASITGVMSEIFRTQYATSRSIHPTHSVSGRGQQASYLLSRHHLDDTPVSANSPYGLMRDHDAHVLMIGCGLEACTAIHLAEEAFATDIYLRPTVEAYSCKDRSGAIHAVRTRRHWRLDRDFPRFAPLLAAKKRLRSGHIEDCPYLLVSMQHLLAEVNEAFRHDLNATLRH
jgi:aminoglycoside 3-N-acetyltransferase